MYLLAGEIHGEAVHSLLLNSLFKTVSSKIITTLPSDKRRRLLSEEIIKSASLRSMIKSVGLIPYTPDAKMRKGLSPTILRNSGESPEGLFWKMLLTVE
jgi:hypothetical protein